MFSYDTVDSITTGFRKTVDKLKSLSEKRRAAAVYNNQLSREYASAALAHDKEADRADRISAKINGLLEE